MRHKLPNCRWLLMSSILAATALGAGCASAPVPDAQLAVSRNAIDDALTAGAAQAAPVELQNAREKMARADAAFAAEKYGDARKLAEEAELDARLAAAKARTTRANLAAVEIQKSIRVLRENLGSEYVADPPPPPLRKTP